VRRRRRRRRAYVLTNNIASHFYHEKSNSRVPMSLGRIGLRLAAFGAAGARTDSHVTTKII